MSEAGDKSPSPEDSREPDPEDFDIRGKVGEPRDPRFAYPKGSSLADEIGELAARYDVPPRRMESAMLFATELVPEEVELMSALRRVGARDERAQLAKGMLSTLEELRAEDPEEDPLAEVDDPITPAEKAAALAWVEQTSRERRRRVLRDCVDAQKAGELTGRSRQSVERLRRDGRVLALRVGRQWRYPVWQFDPDARAGVVPHLSEVVDLLFLSPQGAALWLLEPKEELDGRAPVEYLRARKAEPVIELATAYGYMA